MAGVQPDVSALGGTVSSDTSKAGTVRGGVWWMFVPSAKLEYPVIDIDDTSVTLFGSTFTGRARDNILDAILDAGVNDHF